MNLTFQRKNDKLFEHKQPKIMDWNIRFCYLFISRIPIRFRGKNNQKYVSTCLLT